MTVIEISGDDEFQRQLRNASGKLVVVDFSATWCGPCQFIKPHFENFARTYSDVVFLGVDEANNRSVISAMGVRGFPTFHFYLNQRKVDELVGADPNALRQKIEQWRQSAFNPFASPGVTLGSAGTATNMDPREARLKRFGDVNLVPKPAAAAPPPTPAPAPASASSDLKIVCDPNGTCRLETPDDNSSNALPPVNEEFLQQLIDMGFAEIRSRKALLASNNESLEAGIAWLSEHQDDPDIDDPIQFMDLSKEPARKPLTEEEKMAKLAELKQKIKERRAERDEVEKKKEFTGELERRAVGQAMLSAREEYEATQRKLHAEKVRKEREDAKRERERLRKQIEMDKLERRAFGGKLTGAPVDHDALKQQLQQQDADKLAVQQQQDQETANSSLTPEQQVMTSIDKLKQYRVANDGLTALRTLNVYVKNLLEKPDDAKFRSINLDNAAFRKRVGSLLGGIAFLKAIGFDKQETTLEMAQDRRDEKLLKYAKRQLEAAIAQLS